MKKKARVIAYYLPQFHPIPENDKYWGKGFTEWVNVAKAKPLFHGHYQPRIPADLGFYDLRLPLIREQQAEMARAAGIEGFMYWHYWFGEGRMALQDIWDEVIATGSPDFPICLGWANHSWTTKSWKVGRKFHKDPMIFEMKYPGKSDYEKHFRYCLPAFKDKRYIKVDGKVLFFIWEPESMPDVCDFINCWREMAKKEGLAGIHFVALRTNYTPSIENLLSMGFDAVNCCHQYHAENHALGSLIMKKIRSAIVRLTSGAFIAKRIYNYGKIIKYLSLPEDKEECVYPTIVAGYDRTARAGKKATIYTNFTPDLFRRHVKEVVNSVKDKEDEHKIVFLKSWNEWAEGNYVEPDLKYGHGFLDVLRNELIDY